MSDQHIITVGDRSVIASCGFYFVICVSCGTRLIRFPTKDRALKFAADASNDGPCIRCP